MTALSRESGRTELQLAAEASRAALADAGLEPGGVDAILTYHLNDSAPVLYLARELRLPRIGWHNEIYGGSFGSAAVLTAP
jgi:3-oxoacyl-[acyl-carrier-protein] synthase III